MRLMEYKGHELRIIDTAGIRRKGKTHLMAEKLSVVMARRHLESADVALLMIDATEGVTASDATIGGYAHESGRSVIIVVNKWDLVTTGRTDGKPPADRMIFERQAREVLKYLSYAPVVFISAWEGRNVTRVLDEVLHVATERRKRVSTGQMNRFLDRIDFQRASVPMSKRVRIYYMTQAAVAPPTFRALHRSRCEAAFFLRAISRESNSRGVWLWGHADLVQSACAQQIRKTGLRCPKVKLGNAPPSSAIEPDIRNGQSDQGGWMSRIRTKPTASARRRDIFRAPQTLGQRETRAEHFSPEPLLEYGAQLEGHLKWCGLFYGGEFRAG